jgi:DNA-binding CsgD family transcriptional regulator
MEREQVQLLEEAIAKLPEEQRQLITLWHREEKSFEEIASILGCSPNTVRARWLRAIKCLQRDLQADLDSASEPAASSRASGWLGCRPARNTAPTFAIEPTGWECRCAQRPRDARRTTRADALAASDVAQLPVR